VIWIARSIVGIGAIVALAQLWVPDRWMLQTWIAAGTPWIYLPALPLLGWALYRRRWTESAPLAVVAALWTGWMAPQVVGEEGGEPDVRVASINALAWNADHAAAAHDMAAIEADVLAIQEVSPELATALQGDAFDRWPHRVVLPRQDAFGIAVLSRVPMDARFEELGAEVSEGSPVDSPVSEPMVVADLTVDGRALRLLAVHTLPPFDRRYAEVWRRQCAALVSRVAEEERPLVLAGDLNATPFHRVIRELEGLGLSDGHGAVGRGLATTFPTNRWLPPMLLDHVLASEELTFTSVRERAITGSDHRTVVAGLRWSGS
jgi:endonuclease/exonuclease/phosphatase (EEP) superfamily protein YafD